MIKVLLNNNIPKNIISMILNVIFIYEKLNHLSYIIIKN